MTADRSLGEAVPLALVEQSGALANTLKAYRSARGISQRTADRLVGSHGAWGKWEAGDTPGPVYLGRLADLLGLPVREVRKLAGPDRVRRPDSVGEEQSHPIAQARLAAGLSAAEFARRLHVSASLVSRWEAGERLPPRWHFAAIAQVIGRDVDAVADLFGHRVATGDSLSVPSLRAVRERRGLTRSALAARLGVDITTVQRWERQGRAPYRQTQAAAAALGVDLAALTRPVLVGPLVITRVTPLRRLRLQRQLSIGVVAARAGVPQSSLRVWERGKSRPTWAQARALARALKAPVSTVFAAARLDTPHYLNPTRWTPDHMPEILAELRRWHGWTQGDLAHLAGVSTSAVRAWEQGRNRPRARALNCLDQNLKAAGRIRSLAVTARRGISAPRAGNQHSIERSDVG